MRDTTNGKDSARRILIWLVAIIIVLLSLPKVERFVNNIPIRQLLNQVLAFPLPEKTEVYSKSNAGDASLIVSSDLPLSEIRSYYRNVKLKPVLFNKQEKVYIYVDEWDLDAILYFIAETKAERLVTEAKYQHYYTILLSFSEHGNGSGSIRNHR